MLKNVSTLHLYFSILFVFISFFQAYYNWNERFIFSLLSLVLGSVLLILSVLVVIKKKKEAHNNRL